MKFLVFMLIVVYNVDSKSATNSASVKLKSSIFSSKLGVNKSASSLPKCSAEKSETTCVAGNKCIKHFQICDGFADCPDRTDEANCECKINLIIRNSICV